MTDDMEQLLLRFRPAGPPPHVRDKILRLDMLRTTPRPLWPMRLFRTAVAALLLLSLGLLHAASLLNHDSASRVGIGPPRWTPQAQQAAELLGNDPAARQYVALCLIAGNHKTSLVLERQRQN